MKHEYPDRICLNPKCKKVFTPGHHRQGLCSPECKNTHSRARHNEYSANIRKNKPERLSYPKSKPNRGEGAYRGNVYAWKRYFEKNNEHFKTLYPGRDLAWAVKDMVRIGAL